ncbi:MAG TPA: glycosyltransferase family 2 protein [Polyangia bacterium]|jgi:cellulose synthase/poly-beta-1,6-N-acetylglucosamine synthase-like glycosyltransferase|nr:glycosyltransferase family 2 protein [Polyangia bacterium]
MNALIVVLWASVVAIVYPYLIYPALIWSKGRIWPRPVKRRAHVPSVTVLIPAYNEVDCIGETVRNKLEQDYPSEQLQIIVISDGSTDGTDEVVQGFAERGVKLLRRGPREGKAAALNEAVKQASGEIIVFSDANSLFAADAIRTMVESFADPEVGYVTGNLRFVAGTDSSASGGGNNAYMRYENAIRAAETQAGSIIGVNGGVDAIRRALYVDIPRQLITDFILPLHVIDTGHRVIYDARVSAREVANKELASEFRMRVRVALRALQGLVYMRRLLNPMRRPAATFSIVSHKILRYGAFVFLPIALLSNAVLAVSSPFYRALFVAHALVYALGALGLRRRLPRPLRALTIVPTYFMVTNAAFAVAVAKFVRGETMATWQPRAG